MTRPPTTGDRDSNGLNSRNPLRLWPGVTIVALQWLVTFGVPLVARDAEVFSLPIGLIAVIAGVLGGLAIVMWWVFFSRALWSERLGAIILIIFAVFATRLAVHESIAGAGMGMLLYISSIPYLSLALVAWAVATRNFSNSTRRAALIGAIVLACAPWALLRTAGVSGAGSEFHWRWTPTPEQQLLAKANDEPLESIRGEQKALPSPTAPAEIPKEPSAAKVSDTPVDVRRAQGRPGGVEGRYRSGQAGGRAREAPRHRSRQACNPRKLQRQRRPKSQLAPRPRHLSGRGFAAPSATASSATASGSRLTGPHRRPSSCGAGQSDPAGLPSPSAAICSTRRSSEVTTRSSPATRLRLASQCGSTAIRSGSGSRMPALVHARRRPSTRSRLHVWCDRNSECARRR